MMFYFLIFAVVFTTAIFGIFHSQNARENLHLQTFYEWSVQTTKYFLPFLFNDETYADEFPRIEIIDVINDSEMPNLMKTESLQSVEEMDEFRIGDEHSVGSSNDSLHNEQRNNTPTMELDHERIFETIHASLRKLSSTANVVKMNGNELYNLFLKELILHHNAPSNSRETETTGVQGYNKDAVVEVKEVEMQADETDTKPKMYFGESPLEYVPHQK